MSIVNATGRLLRVYFKGPTSATIDVPDGKSADVQLSVGQYEVAGEVPGSPVQPFYGS